MAVVIDDKTAYFMCGSVRKPNRLVTGEYEFLDPDDEDLDYDTYQLQEYDCYLHPYYGDSTWWDYSEPVSLANS